jgi:hypothetical protein
MAGPTVNDKDEAAEHELVMPFVAVTSEGGPFDDEAYSGGWEMGALDMFLAANRPPFHGQHILAENAKQADLIGMKHGYKVTVRVMDDNPDWSWLELELDSSDTTTASVAPGQRVVWEGRLRRWTFRGLVLVLAYYFGGAVGQDFATGGNTVEAWINLIAAAVAVPSVCVEAWRLTRRAKP